MTCSLLTRLEAHKAETGTSLNFLKVIVESQKAEVEYVEFFDMASQLLINLESLVAVHGLNPINKSFHAEGTWTAGEKLWLRDFLPQRLPGARIMLFGYNSNVAFRTSTAGVYEHAENLLCRLKAKRTVTHRYPPTTKYAD